MKDLIRIEGEITNIAPEILGYVYGWPVSNSFLATVLIVLLVAFMAFVIVPKFGKSPKTFQGVVEMAYEAMTNLISEITSSKKLARNVIPLVSALMVFIGLSNFFGLLPIFPSISWNGASMFRSPTSDFNTTLALALGVLVIIQIDSIRVWGPIGYVGRFLKFKELWVGVKGGFKSGMLAFIEFLIGLLDIVSEIAKVISLSFRLFGNMFAGEVLMVLILSAFAFFLPTLWLSMSTLFALVQAIVFSSLAAAYYTLSMREDSN